MQMKTGYKTILHLYAEPKKEQIKRIQIIKMCFISIVG